MENDKVQNGIIAELSSSILTYPLNTIKTNRQVNRIPVSLFKGIQYCILGEFINAFFFYNIYNKLKQKNNPLLSSGIASISGIALSYPFFLNKKLAQINKPTQLSYKGVVACAFNMIPNVCINFALREKINIGIASGFLTTSITAVVTNPLDILSTKIMTRTPIKFDKNILFTGLYQRILEKNLTTGSKMVLLDYLKGLDKKNQLCQSSSGNSVSL